MSEQETRILVGRRVREERQAAGYGRLEDFAAELGIDPTNLSRIERGERGLDSLLLARIATLLNVPMDAFFDAERGEVLSMARGGGGERDDMVDWGLELLADIDFAEGVIGERGW
jgi:transcriptional regulator with XRE-family HTH domain